jgi:hypothetical protein
MTRHNLPRLFIPYHHHAPRPVTLAPMPKGWKR